MSEKIVTCRAGVTGSNVTSKAIGNEVYHTHYVYNMNVKPSEIDALLAKSVKKYDGRATESPKVKGRTVWSHWLWHWLLC